MNVRLTFQSKTLKREITVIAEQHAAITLYEC